MIGLAAHGACTTRIEQIIARGAQKRGAIDGTRLQAGGENQSLLGPQGPKPAQVQLGAQAVVSDAKADKGLHLGIDQEPSFGVGFAVAAVP